MSQITSPAVDAPQLTDQDREILSTVDTDTESSEGSHQESLENDDEFSWDDCTSILRGRMVPPYRDFSDHQNSSREEERAIYCCLIYAIRRYLPYAQQAEVLALCHRVPAVARARNARLIMSNAIPQIEQKNHFPYCIWYPDIATEDTYRTVAARYPELKYNVGRACAVAGYNDLYRELDILPEVSIAEEARERDKGQVIFHEIMDKPTRYKVMDDYERIISEKPVAGAGLNGDTEVIAYLLYDRLTPREAAKGHDRYGYFDITEDLRVSPPQEEDASDEEEDHEPSADEQEGDFKSLMDPVFGPEDAWLFYSPLPHDLPPINKDLLILRAAWEGNVDRYARLRRPCGLPFQSDCVIRGIYHSTPFARWWAAQPDCNEDYLEAARARFVMMNDLSWLRYPHPLDGRKGERVLPRYMIWWPVQPEDETLRALLRWEPRTKAQVAHAAIYCDYQWLFEEIDPSPNGIMEREARWSANPLYREHLDRKESDPLQGRPDRDAWYCSETEKERRCTIHWGSVGTPSFADVYEGGPYLCGLLREADKQTGLAIPWYLDDMAEQDKLTKGE